MGRGKGEMGRGGYRLEDVGALETAVMLSSMEKITPINERGR